MMKRLVLLICIIFFSTTCSSLLSAQNEKQDSYRPAKEHGYFSSENWCHDQTTISFSESAKHRAYLSGIRIIFEPQFGTLVQFGDNKFKVDDLIDLPKIGFETNIYKGWMAFQFGVLYPSSIKYDEDSPIVKNQCLITGNDVVDVEIGGTIGLSFIDGIIACGIASVRLEERDFRDSYTGDFIKNFIYFNVQPAAVIRGLIKNLRQ